MTSTDLVVFTEASAPVRLRDAIERPIPKPPAPIARPSNLPAALLGLLAFVELLGTGIAAMHLLFLQSLIGAVLFVVTGCVALAKVR